jgi:hypothetical protein
MMQMTEDEAREALARYEAMLARAIPIVRAVQDRWWGHCDDEDAQATLRIKGDVLTLEWAEYDDGHAARDVSFPVSLIVASDDEVSSWIAATNEAQRKADEDFAARRREDKESHERAEFERLRAKFGGYQRWASIFRPRSWTS